MRRGIIGFLILLLGVAIFAVILITVQSKLLGKSTRMEETLDLENGQTTPTSTNPKDVQNRVNDLQNQLQQKQNESLGEE